MIATHLELKLRNGLFGMFSRHLDPLTPECWQEKVVQAVELHSLKNGPQWYAPDRYRLNISSAMIGSFERFYSFQYLVREFIRDYIQEAGYAVAAEVSVEINPLKDRIYGNIEIIPSFSEAAGRVRNLKIVVSRISERYTGISAIHLSGPGSFYIGRSDTAHIRLRHMCVSHHHALLSISEEGRSYVKDLHSTNGTAVNRVKVEPNAAHELRIPSEIRIADTFELLVLEQKSQQSTH
ncbi:FHA domain-containing protein [candidate division KSB1 bacterium]